MGRHPRRWSSRAAVRPVTPAPITMTSSLKPEAMDVSRERLDGLQRTVGEYAVAEVEDVSGASGRAAQDVVRRADHAVGGAQQPDGIEVALDPAVVADPVP